MRQPTATVFLLCRFGTEWRIGLIRHPRHHRWMPPGGHLEPGESPAEAAVREVVEETGLRPRLIDSLGVVEYEVSPGRTYLDHWYLAVAGAPAPAGPAELEVAWFAAAELAGLGMYPNSRRAAELVLRGGARPGLRVAAWEHRVVTSDVVGRAFDWIEAAEVPEDGLYAGTAGVLLGCAEAASAGVTAPAAGRVAHAARERLLRVTSLPEDGVFDGWAGVAIALRAWGTVAGDPVALEAGRPIMAGVAERARGRLGDPARCTDIISGDAGILLALVAFAEDAAAVAVAEGLVGLALDRPDGLHWRMSPDYENLMPGFSHGTAGVAYALAAAGRSLGRADLVRVAVRAADGLIALGTRDGGWKVPLLIPHKPGRPEVNFGWCHGPAGTIRLFALLDEIEPDPRWGRAIGACLQALRDSRLPERLYPGYWDNVARCCGTAGVGQVLLDRYQATGDPALLAWSAALADDVLGRALPTPAGVTWSNTEHTATPPELPPEPGFMQGSAGIAGWLARLGAPGTPAVLPWI